MITRSEIEQVRIAINDPPDILQFATVARKSELPQQAAPQTAYYDEAQLLYWIADAGLSPSEYEVAELQISDAVISRVVDQLGVDAAECRLLGLIARKLGAKLAVVRSTVGSDTTQYQTISGMLAYYKTLADDCNQNVLKLKGNNSGKYKSMKPPCIGGGNL